MKKILIAFIIGVFMISCSAVKPAKKKSNTKTQVLPPNTASNKHSAKRNQ